MKKFLIDKKNLNRFINHNLDLLEYHFRDKGVLSFNRWYLLLLKKKLMIYCIKHTLNEMWSDVEVYHIEHCDVIQNIHKDTESLREALWILLNGFELTRDANTYFLDVIDVGDKFYITLEKCDD